MIVRLVILSACILAACGPPATIARVKQLDTALYLGGPYDSQNSVKMGVYLLEMVKYPYNVDGQPEGKYFEHWVLLKNNPTTIYLNKDYLVFADRSKRGKYTYDVLEIEPTNTETDSSGFYTFDYVYRKHVNRNEAQYKRLCKRLNITGFRDTITVTGKGNDVTISYVLK